MIFPTTPTHSTEGVSAGLPQITKTQISNVDLFCLGLVLIVALLLSRKVALILYKQYQLERIAVSIQRRASLERQYRNSSRSASRNLPRQR